MKISRLAYALFLMPYLVWSQSAEDVEDDKTLLQEAINIEASSSNDASNRQEFIDNIDAEIITLT